MIRLIVEEIYTDSDLEKLSSRLNSCNSSGSSITIKSSIVDNAIILHLDFLDKYYSLDGCFLNKKRKSYSLSLYKNDNGGYDVKSEYPRKVIHFDSDSDVIKYFSDVVDSDRLPNWLY